MLQIDDKTLHVLDREIQKKYYNMQRYGENATFALLYTEEELEKEALGRYVRLSDEFIKIDKHHYFIIFNHTDETSAFKASENLLCKIDNKCENPNSYVALEPLQTQNSTQATLNKLYTILDTMKKLNHKVDDENILDEIV